MTAYPDYYTNSYTSFNEGPASVFVPPLKFFSEDLSRAWCLCVCFASSALTIRTFLQNNNSRKYSWLSAIANCLGLSFPPAKQRSHFLGRLPANSRTPLREASTFTVFPNGFGNTDHSEHGQDWIRTEANFNRIRTGSDCNFFRIGGWGLDRTTKIFVVSMWLIWKYQKF